MIWVILIIVFLAFRNKAGSPGSGASSVASIASSIFGHANPGTSVLRTPSASGFNPMPPTGFLTPTPVQQGASLLSDAELVLPTDPTTQDQTPVVNANDSFDNSGGIVFPTSGVGVQIHNTLGVIQGPVSDEPQLPLVLGATIQAPIKPFFTPTPPSELAGGSGRAFVF